jgi:energy-coupling factor transporter ATP-binding protein EcfA2
LNRLKIKEAVVKQLFALSGNQCAFPDCDQYLVKDGRVLGEMCHIVAAKGQGPRNDPGMTEEQRRDFSNLILLCRLHHEETHDEEKYPVQTLINYKSEHEQNCGRKPYQVSDEAVATVIQNYEQYFQQHGPGNQINLVGSHHNTINITAAADPQFPAPGPVQAYKKLDEDFWEEIAGSGIATERFLLNLHSEESVICKAILDGMASEVECHFEEENFFDHIEWDIAEKLKNKKKSLLLILSPPGSGKTTLLYTLAYKFRQAATVIRLSAKLDRRTGFIAQQGIILIDEIALHREVLEHYHAYFTEAFPAGFILLLAEQNVIWDQYKGRNRLLRQYEQPERVAVQPRSEHLQTIFGQVISLLDASGRGDELGKFRNAFVKVSRNDQRTIADRLIELYHSSGIARRGSSLFLKPDWITLEEIGDPGLSELYCLTAFMNAKNEHFDLRLIQDKPDRYANALAIITDSRDGSYPLELTAGFKLRLRHHKLATWYFLENERKKGLAELFFRNKFRQPDPGPEIVSALRHFYQADKTGTLAFLDWSARYYYETLKRYYLAHRDQDSDEQGQKCLQESLKVLFQLDRIQYEKEVAAAARAAQGPAHREWLGITVTRNLIRAGEFSTADATLKQLEALGFTTAELSVYRGDIDHFRLVRLLTTGELSGEDIRDLSFSAIQRLARELAREHYRSVRHKYASLLASYFENGTTDDQLTQHEFETLLASYCNRLLAEKDYGQVILTLSKYPVDKSPLLQSFLGFSLLHQPSGSDPAALLQGKELIIGSFFLRPTNPSAMHYLSFILNKDRLPFSDQELAALKTKISELQQFGAHPLFFKVLSDITRRMNDTEGAIRLLQDALEQHPRNDTLRLELVTMLMAREEERADLRNEQEVSALLGHWADKESDYYKLSLIKFYHTYRRTALRENNLAAVLLAEDLLGSDRMNMTAKFFLVKSQFYAGEYRQCLEAILSHFFDQGLYEEYDINNLFYSCLFNLSRNNESFIRICQQYQAHIDRVLRDELFETNDYFQYVSSVVNRLYKAPGGDQRMKELEKDIRSDHIAARNTVMLMRVVYFLFKTAHYNSVHRILHAIKKDNAQHLPPNLIFKYKACSVICNNRMFIDRPVWAEKNFVLFPKELQEQELSKLVGEYLSAFNMLRYYRRKIVFCQCVVRSYPDQARLVKRMQQEIGETIRQLYGQPLPSVAGDRKGILYKTKAGQLEIRIGPQRWPLADAQAKAGLDQGELSVNWSYFIPAKGHLANFVEPGFVINGHHDSELEKGTNRQKSPQGSSFGDWLHTWMPEARTEPDRREPNKRPPHKRPPC